MENNSLWELVKEKNDQEGKIILNKEVELILEKNFLSEKDFLNAPMESVLGVNGEFEMWK